MNFYSFHIGDYKTHTFHLSLLEDLAYRRMLDLYYTHESPLPASPEVIAIRIGMRDHVMEVASVLEQFFVDEPDCWRSPRCDEEIARMQDKQAKARESGLASARARKANAGHSHDDGSTDGQRTLNEGSTTNTNTITNISPTLRSGEKRVAGVKKPDDIPDKIWRDFATLRKAKRSPLTESSFEIIEREAKKAGITTAEALTICIERGWQGFKADWDWRRSGAPRKAPAAEDFANKDYGSGDTL